MAAASAAKRAASLVLFAVVCLSIPSAISAEFFCGRENCFAVLGIKREDANATTVKKVYRTLSRELHPDKNPSEDAAVRFHRVANAYEILTDPEKRAEYEDFLDHPEKYYQYYLMHMRDQYVPKSSTPLVIFGILVVATTLDYLNQRLNFQSAAKRARSTTSYRDKVTELLKSGTISTPMEAEALIHVEVVGASKPTLRTLLPFKIVGTFKDILRAAYRAARWQVRYRVLKKELTTDDKILLIREAFRFSKAEWDALPEPDRADMVERRVWEKKARDEYVQWKRIEWNRSGRARRRMPRMY